MDEARLGDKKVSERDFSSRAHNSQDKQAKSLSFSLSGQLNSSLSSRINRETRGNLKVTQSERIRFLWSLFSHLLTYFIRVLWYSQRNKISFFTITSFCWLEFHVLLLAWLFHCTYKFLKSHNDVLYPFSISPER